MASIFRYIGALLHRFSRSYYSVLNSRYRLYNGISDEVVFCSSFPGLVDIIFPEHAVIEKGSVINAASVLHCAGGLTIGHHCHFGHGLTIYTSTHDYRSDSHIPYGIDDLLKPVVIKDCVWIGACVTILPGVIIGEGVVVGAGSLINKDVPDYAIVAGNPARIVGSRNVEVYKHLKKSKAFN